jgi:hypothetical protein
MTPKQIYQQLVELHGTQQDAELRQMNEEALEQLAQFAEAKPPLPFLGISLIAFKVRDEQRRRAALR